MKKVPMMSWGDRFALIDSYKPSNLAICQAFNLSMAELETANKLRSKGTFAPNTKLDVTKFAGIFSDIPDDDQQTIDSTKPKKVGTVTTHVRPETATKKVQIKEPQKRGRKGDKIAQALLAVTSTPTPVEQFTKDHNVSLATLRQSKRFMEHMSQQDIQRIGKINVRKDKVSKVLMIWREDL